VLVREYFKKNQLFPQESIYNPSTLIYSVEVVSIVITSVIGILVNALLGSIPL
jgi:hypothetical protein